MGFFTELKEAAGNWLELKNLDLQSDMLISSVSGFETVNVKNDFRKMLWQEIQFSILNSSFEKYDVETVALIKMLRYYRMSGDDPVSLSIKEKLTSGIQKLRKLKGDDLDPAVLLEIYAVLGSRSEG